MYLQSGMGADGKRGKKGKLGVVVNTTKYNTQEARSLHVQGQPGKYREFQTSLDFRKRLSQKRKGAGNKGDTSI